MNIKFTKREYIIAGVLIFIAAYFFLGKIITTALLGVVGGTVIGANLPVSWRAKLFMGGRRADSAKQTITVEPSPSSGLDPTKH